MVIGNYLIEYTHSWFTSFIVLFDGIKIVFFLLIVFINYFFNPNFTKKILSSIFKIKYYFFENKTMIFFFIIKMGLTNRTIEQQ